jgi:hypothetical protein
LHPWYWVLYENGDGGTVGRRVRVTVGANVLVGTGVSVGISVGVDVDVEVGVAVGVLVSVGVQVGGKMNATAVGVSSGGLNGFKATCGFTKINK